LHRQKGIRPVKATQRSAFELEILAKLFYSTVDELGDFVEVDELDLPTSYRELLAHDRHMTVALESHYGTPVDVQVLKSYFTKNHYLRRILLNRRSDGGVVMFGIVRITLALLAPEVRQEILEERTALGRILIQRNVLRNVRLMSLWKVMPGEDLRGLLGEPENTMCYGRTVLMYCDGVPVIELLEIVKPT
jgi:chorismate-pyruvate lyase